ncbi:MAG: hypothetical protein Q8Q85_10905, partial [Gemmatimonadales bacterium]|nr:hypothetical protein [Gemmatimonadales bacterium]
KEDRMARLIIAALVMISALIAMISYGGSIVLGASLPKWPMLVLYAIAAVSALLTLLWGGDEVHRPTLDDLADDAARRQSHSDG